MENITPSITTAEAIKLRDYVLNIADAVPNGLSGLSDTLSFVAMDLMSFARFGIKQRSFDSAVAFARSIPKFDDLESEACIDWMLHDVEHLKYQW